MTDKQITADLYFMSKLLDGQNFQQVYDETYYMFFRYISDYASTGEVYD